MTEAKEKDVTEYATDLQELFSTLDLTALQSTALNLILQRMNIGATVADLKGEANSAKANAKRMKYLMLDAAKLEGRLDGKNTDERKLAREVVDATDDNVLTAQEIAWSLQTAHDQAESVYSNLYHLYEVLIEAVKNENA